MNSSNFKLLIICIITIFILTIFFLKISICQSILLFEKPGTINNIKFRAGDRIELKTTDNEIYEGLINQIRDTAIVINYKTILCRDIKCLYLKRKMLYILSHAGIKAGIGYIGIDALNNLINGETTILRNSTLKTGSIMFGAGLLMRLLSGKKIKIDNKAWRIKVLDFAILKDPGIYNKHNDNNKQLK